MNVYAFGAFRLHAERLFLTQNGRSVTLGPKVVETLLALVERAPAGATKDELLQRIWPEGFVEESNLTQNVYVLRKVLRLGGMPDAIETLPRIGYRFTAVVHRIAEHQPRIGFSLAAAAFAACCIVLAGGLTFGHRYEHGANVSANAARLYEIGRYFWELRTPDGVRKSLRYFEASIEADPGNARAYAALADANVTMADYCYGEHAPADYFQRARAYAERALTLDPNSAQAHATLGFIALDTGNSRAAIMHLRRAAALDSSDATVQTWYGIALVERGRLPEGVRHLLVAHRLNPLSVVPTSWLAAASYRNGRVGDAIRYAREALELAPQRVDALRTLGTAYEAGGDVNRAIETFKAYGAVDDYYRPQAAALLARAYALDHRDMLARKEAAYARAFLRPHRVGVENAIRLL